MSEKSKLDRDALAAKQQAAEIALDRSEAKSRYSSAAVTVLVHVIIALLLTLILIVPPPEDISPLVAATNEGLEKDDLNKKDFARSVQQKPQPAQSASRVTPIASAVTSPVAVPTFEDPVEDPLGLGVDFGKGFGYGRGTGGGGGGGSISFYGAPTQSERVVFIVDFSNSMEALDATGSSRLARLRSELTKSINSLPKGMPFQVIYYSTEPWLGGNYEQAPTLYPDNPGDRPHWSTADADGIGRAVATVRSTSPPVGAGATLWKKPLQLALAMSPPPSDIYLLSDGEAQDGDEVLSQIRTINPNGVAIHAIGLELAGVGFKTLCDISRATGGTQTLVLKGKTYSGPAALRYATDEFDLGSEFDL